MDTLFEHISKRVKELGYTDFAMQTVLIKSTQEKLQYHLKAFNELYFLMSELPSGSRIISDTNALEIDEQFNSSKLKSFQEFTGNIELRLSDYHTSAIEFLRVIPN